MSRKHKKNYNIIGSGSECRKCGGTTQRREKKFIKEGKSYYSEWDFCVQCNATFFDEQYRVFSNTIKMKASDLFY